jgi:hypothetical protein
MKYIAQLILLAAMIFIGQFLYAQSVEPFDLDQAWIDKIRDLAPDEPEVKPENVPRILVFTLSTAFQHWAVPHKTAIMEVLSDKTGAFVMDHSADIQVFEDLKGYDAVLLNNNCSAGERRDLFWDELGMNKDLTDKEREKMAARLGSSMAVL